MDLNLSKHTLKIQIVTCFFLKNRNRDLAVCLQTEDKILNKELVNKTSKIASNNKVFKTLRLVLPCTGEYAAYYGGTQIGALSGMNATMKCVTVFSIKTWLLNYKLLLIIVF
jgi:hypothetical protein